MARLVVVGPVVLGLLVLAMVLLYAAMHSAEQGQSSAGREDELRSALDHTLQLLHNAEKTLERLNRSRLAVAHSEEEELVRLTERLARLEAALAHNQAQPKPQSHPVHVSNVAAPPPAPGAMTQEEALAKQGQIPEHFKVQPTDTPTAVIVIACNRETVSSCLDQLIRYRPSKTLFPIIVSQDCGHLPTKKVIQQYQDVELIEQPDLSNPKVPPQFKNFVGYAKIARHFEFALGTVFARGFDSVIIVEDDLNIAPDFYDYFLAGKRLLQQDPTLWCISAWNDNGKRGQVMDPEKLYRSDFFPGLGWMMTKTLWDELGPKWAKMFWDDWMREPVQRRGRACIRPEISRTRTFGRKGVSSGQFFDQHLKFIQLNTEHVPFLEKDLSHLLKDNYDPAFHKEVYEDAEQTTIIGLDDIEASNQIPEKPLRIEYADAHHFTRIAKKLNIMDDAKAGVPRGAYQGIVPVWYKNMKIYVAPRLPWDGYKK